MSHLPSRRSREATDGVTASARLYGGSLDSAKKAYLTYVEEARPGITFGLTGQDKVFQFRDEILGSLDEPGAVDAFVNVLLDRIAASGDDPDVVDAMVGTWTLFSAVVFAYRRDLIGELQEVKERYDL